MTDTGFGIGEREEELYKKYINEWIVIYPHGINGTFSGYCIGVKDGYALLKPFQDGKIKEGRLVRALIRDRKPSIVPLMGGVVEPTTEKHILDYLELMNEKENVSVKNPKSKHKPSKKKT